MAADAEGPAPHSPALQCSMACPPYEAVDYVRKHYDPGAVETLWQRRYVARFLAP